MAIAKKKQGNAIAVRATVAHTQPGTQAYRAEGEEFTHYGELYPHVEPAAGGKTNQAAVPEEIEGEEL